MISDLSLCMTTPSGKIKRPSSRRIARVYPQRGAKGYRAKYRWYAVVGFYKHTRVHYFLTEDEAREFAAKHNTPERLMAAFRQFFDTEGETRAFLGIKKPKPEGPPAPPIEETLTPQQVDKRTRYMIQQQFRVRPLRDNSRPHLKFVVHFRESGKYARRYFKNEREAKAFAQARNTEVASHGLESLDMPGWLRCMALRCNNRLAEVGKTLDDATAHYLDYIKRATASCTLEKMLEEFAERQDSRGYQKYYVAHLRRLIGDFIKVVGPETLACNVTPKQVSDHITALVGYKPKTVNNYLRSIATYFNFGVRQGYLDKSPARNVSYLPMIDEPPGVITPNELERILQAASGTDMLPFYAIGAFAGIRVAEIQRLDWSEVDFEGGYIEITALKAKTSSRRLVKIQPILAEWLAPYAGRTSGPVLTPVSNCWFSDKRKEILRAADALVPANERGEGYRSLESDWPHNALRHSFASYHIAKFNDAAALALEMGHATTGMIFKHYRRVVRPAQAELYWNVRPVSFVSNVVPLLSVTKLVESDATHGATRG